MGNLTVPDEYDDWPFDARKFVLAEANTAEDIREEINSLTGIETVPEGKGADLQFTKEDACILIMALGGPQDV